MKKPWFALVCLSLAACAPVGGGTSYPTATGLPSGGNPVGKPADTRPSPVLITRNGWLLYAPSEPVSVKEMPGNTVAGNREAYYGRAIQALQGRDAIRDAEDFKAKHGYVFLKTKLAPDKVFGEGPVIHSSGGIGKFLPDYSGLYRCPAWRNSEAEEKKTCPRNASNALFLQGR